MKVKIDEEIPKLTMERLKRLKSMLREITWMIKAHDQVHGEFDIRDAGDDFELYESLGVCENTLSDQMRFIKKKICHK